MEKVVKMHREINDLDAVGLHPLEESDLHDIEGGVAPPVVLAVGGLALRTVGGAAVGAAYYQRTGGDWKEGALVGGLVGFGLGSHQIGRALITRALK